MNIEKKIEEIRKQPEHIRVRYVIGAVAISMFFVLIIWFASMKQAFYNLKSSSISEDLPDTSEIFQELDQVKESVQSLDEVLNADPDVREGQSESMK